MPESGIELIVRKRLRRRLGVLILACLGYWTALGAATFAIGIFLGALDAAGWSAYILGFSAGALGWIGFASLLTGLHERLIYWTELDVKDADWPSEQEAAETKERFCDLAEKNGYQWTVGNDGKVHLEFDLQRKFESEGSGAQSRFTEQPLDKQEEN